MSKFRRFFAAFSPFFIGVHFVRFSGVQEVGNCPTYVIPIHPVTCPYPCHWHGKGRFWAPLALFASRVGKMVAATIKSPWRASCGPVCQYLALSRASCRHFSPAHPLGGPGTVAVDDRRGIGGQVPSWGRSRPRRGPVPGVSHYSRSFHNTQRRSR